MSVLPILCLILVFKKGYLRTIFQESIVLIVLHSSLSGNSNMLEISVEREFEEVDLKSVTILAEKSCFQCRFQVRVEVSQDDIRPSLMPLVAPLRLPR